VLSGGVWDITAGGNMNNTPPLATLAPQPRAVVEVEPVGMLASTQSGTVLQVTNGVVTTFATGLKQYGHGIVHVPGCGDGFLDPGEDCDDANQLDNDGCTTICALGNGGEGGAGGTGGEGGTNGVGGMGSGGSDAVGGSGGSDGVGGMGSGGTTNPSGGNAFPEGEPITEDGCACSTAGGDRNDAPWGASLMLLGLGLILRRRR
jgi:MYXO-CTERM domain-containing protein